MRKDVRLGLVLGGVLLAVLIMYVLVVPGEKPAVTDQANGGGNVAVDPQANAGGPVDAGMQRAGTQAAGVQTTGGVDAAGTGASWGNTAATAGTTDTQGRVADPAVTNTGPVATATGNNDLGTQDWGPLLAGHARLDSSPRQAAGRTGGSAAANAPADAETDGAAPGVNTTSNDSFTFTPNYQVPTQTASSAAMGGSYVIKSGDTLSSIAQEAYGSAKYYPAIERANPHLDPQRLRVGMTINLPEKAQVIPSNPANASSGGSAHQAGIDTSKQYKVQSGDSLYRISLKLYGTSNYADQIYDLNKATIGSDPAKLKIDMVLQLPKAPTQGQ